MRHNIIFLSIAIALLISLILLSSWACSPNTATQSTSATTEATEFQGVKLTPISQQGNNALAGTQRIDEATYKLTVSGLVDKQLILNYDDLQALPQISKVDMLYCVEGWSFQAKWTGPYLSDILDKAGVRSDATIVIFHTTDVPAGYSSLDINYIRKSNIIIALKLNDITLPQDRGFPFQVVAEGKYGYKWSKWVTGIEVSNNNNFRGYWESRGYNNDATLGGPAFEP